MRPPREDTKPWYKQFWPWFIISIPGGTIVAAMFTIWLAVSESDTLVKDNYYKEGLAVNRDLARERVAKELGIKLALDYDAATGLFTASMNDAPVGDLTSLSLTLTHPTLEDEDRQVSLVKSANGAFSSEPAPPLPSANWHLIVEPPEETWRLRTRWNPTGYASIELPL